MNKKRVSILTVFRKLTGLLIALLFVFSPAAGASAASDAKRPGIDSIERIKPNGGYAIEVFKGG